MKRRADVVEAARSWLGTPYKHQHSAKGLGADCLGLIVGVGHDLGFRMPEKLPPYSSSWDEVQKEEVMLRDFAKYLDAKKGPLQAGDVVVFRMFPNAVAKHCAIVSSPDHMIHSHQRHFVVEVTLGAGWRKRVVGVFTYPGVL